MDKVNVGLSVSLVLILALFGAAIYTDRQAQQQTYAPKFTANQCFVKGLREPWDADVAGKVIRVGHFKYLVMYASEANRNSLGAKQGWEEDIRSFDLKYTLVPCPYAWLHKTRGPDPQERALRIK